jgi:hypothetical protein
MYDKTNPFSHFLHKGVAYKWDDKCDNAFHKIKEYLLTPPVLMPPVPDQPLILYISAIVAALGALLAQQDETRKERVFYYINRTLVGYELNYTSIEKTCLAVVFASQKICHYMLSHPIKLIAKIDPLKYLLAKSTLTRCIGP